MDSKTITIDVIAVFELLTGDLLNNEKWVKRQLDKAIERMEKNEKNKPLFNGMAKFTRVMKIGESQ